MIGIPWQTAMTIGLAMNHKDDEFNSTQHLPTVIIISVELSVLGRVADTIRDDIIELRGLDGLLADCDSSLLKLSLSGVLSQRSG